jgi:hypothetical protein
LIVIVEGSLVVGARPVTVGRAQVSVRGRGVRSRRLREQTSSSGVEALASRRKAQVVGDDSPVVAGCENKKARTALT